MCCVVFQIHFLRLTTAILHHEKSRKYLLNNVLYPSVCCLFSACLINPQIESVLNLLTFDVMRSVVFFYIKTPLRVKEAGLEELILTTWWPTHFDKEVGGADSERLTSAHLQSGAASHSAAVMTHRGRTTASRQTRARTSACGGERTREAARG